MAALTSAPPQASTMSAAVLFAGGGSGGHVFPGLAIAEELCRRGHRVSWTGSRHGLEARLVAERGVDFHALPARPVVGQGLVGKLRAGLTLAASAWRARGLVRRVGASTVVGTGGYVSVPAVLGARLAGRPAILVEPNAAPGAANRLLSRFAAEAAVAYDSTARGLHCPTTTTGVPVRDAFFHLAEAPSEGPLRLLVVGGSQGAKQLNELLPRALARLVETGTLPPLEVVHQAGHQKLVATTEAYAAAGFPASSGEGPKVDVIPFLDDMPAALEAAHLLVSRAGAITLAEICAAGRAAILAPLTIAGGHQVENAERLAEAGAARILRPESDETEAADLLADLLADRDRLGAMGRAARGLAREGAAARIADRIADRITEHAGGGA